jgi:hypothetical protein
MAAYEARQVTVEDGDMIDIPDTASDITIDQEGEQIRVSWLERQISAITGHDS